MIPSNMHPGTAARGLRRAFLQSASDLLTARARRRPADRVRARPRLEGLEDRCLLSITEYPTPTAGANPYSITAGPAGNLWFTEAHVGKIGRINPTNYAITEFAVPSGSNPNRITVGPDGNLWYTEYGGYIGRINPNNTSDIYDFAVPTRPGGITSGLDGNLWYTANGGTGGKIGVFNPTTHQATEYPIPYTPPPGGDQAIGICVDSVGNRWFCDRATNAIGAQYVQNLVVTAQPSTVTAGNGFDLTVQAQDSSGNLVTSFSGTVTVALASNPGGATLGGTLTVTASGGVATFSGLTLTKAASGYTLAATTPGLGQGLTSAMTVTPATATQLVITQQPPATVKVSSPFTMKASIEDTYGNVVTTDSTTVVSVGFANNPTGATLGGTKSVTVSQGVASFTNLTINKTGSGYTLQVTSTGLPSATSNPINVSQNGKAPVRLLPPAGSPSPDLSLAPLVLDSPDLWDGLRFKKRPRSI
jgi:hypothetical protein